MTKINILLVLAMITMLFACSTSKTATKPTVSVSTETAPIAATTATPYNNETGVTATSPNAKTRLTFKLNADGEPTYKIIRNGKFVIGESKMGLKFFDGDFNTSFEVLSSDETSSDDTWKPVWGEVAQIRNNYKALTVHLKHKPSERMMDIVFKIFDDGVGFRYMVLEREGWNQAIVTDETTEFQLMNDNKTFWIPGDYDSNEHVYSTTKVSAINNSEYKKSENAISAMELHDPNSVQTPLTMKNEGDGTYICIHEDRKSVV